MKQITVEELAELERAEEEMAIHLWAGSIQDGEMCVYVPRCSESRPMTWKDLKAAMVNMESHHHGITSKYLCWCRPVAELHYVEAGIAELCGHPEAKTFEELLKIPVEEVPETHEALAHALIVAIHDAAHKMELATTEEEEIYFAAKERVEALVEQVLAR